MAAPVASTYPKWQTDLLKNLGATPNATNLYFLSLWSQSEGVANQNYNWLATTDPAGNYPHAGIVAPNGGDPVYAYPSEAVGIQATSQFLQNGYAPLVKALQGNDLGQMWLALNQSGWCRGCQGGKYPVAVYDALNGKVPTAGPGAGSSDGSSSSTIGCNAGSKGVQLDALRSVPLVGGLAPSVTVFNACQVKAITGGLLVGVGGLVMVVGGVLVLAYGLQSTKIGSAALSVATSGGPIGTVAKTVSRSPVASGAKKVGGAARNQTPKRRAERAQSDEYERDAANAEASQAANEAIYERERTSRNIPKRRNPNHEGPRRPRKVPAPGPAF